MEENKSIDGLSTHTAKKTAKKIVRAKATPKPARRPVAVRTTAPKKPVAKTASIIPDEAIAIEVVDDDTAKIEPDNKVKQSREEAVEDFLNPVQAFNLGDEETDDNAEEDTEMKDDKESKDATILDKKAKKEAKKAKKAEKKAKKKAKKFYKVRRVLSIILLIIVLGAIGVITWAVFWGNDIIAKLTGGQGNIFDLFTLTSETYNPLKTDANGRTNILAIGTSGFNMAGTEEEDGGDDGWIHSGAQLTDSIMMISLNQETGDIAMLSLPRDLKASPTCTATGKINEVYWCNGGGANVSIEDENAAAQALMEEVGYILGVDFQYYAHLNWGSVKNIVDTLGGITITLDEDIEDYYWTGAVYQAGVPYTISGIDAVALARARHGTIGGDFSRGASQQKILVGIKDKIMERGLSIPEIIGLASTLGDNLRTNFTLDELKTAAHLSFDFDLSSMRTISLYNPLAGIYYMTTGTLDNGISYVFPSAGVGNYYDIQEYIRTNLSNDPRSYEFPTIAIYNASETAGLAAAEKTKLEEEGFTINHIDNAPEGEYETGTYLYVINDKPGTRSLLNRSYQINENLPDSIPRDYDFVIILNPEETESNN